MNAFFACVAHQTMISTSGGTTAKVTSASCQSMAQQDRDDDREADEVRQEGERAGGQQVLHDGDVAREAADHAADFHLVVEAEREALHVVVHLAAQLQQEPVAHPRRGQQLDVGRDPGDAGQRRP